LRGLSPPVLLLAVLAAVSPACAAPAASPAPTTQGEPALIGADRISEDEDLGIVIASGHVEISQGDNLVHADTVTYNQRTDMATASGNVSLLEPDGNVAFANYIELTGNLKDGVAQGFRILMSDKSRFAAAGARRSGGTLIEMRKAVYSPCELCKADPTRPPLWQIKADLVVHDMTEHEIYYEDAMLEMFGIPVAYTPYISGPDPTVKRRSGFLPATYGTSTQTGAMLQIPYYWAVTPDIDMTLSPIFTTAAGIVADGEYRERWGDAEIELEGSFTETKRYDEFGGEKPGTAFRGHLVGDGVLNIDENWRTGFDVQRETDQTYLLFYKMLWQPPTILTSDAYVEDFFGRSYQSVFAYDFQDLRVTVNNRQLPIVLPVWNLDYVTKPGPYGDFWTVDWSAYDIARISGPSSRRISTREQWQIPYTSPLGDTTTFTASLESDGYLANDVVNQNNPQAIRSGDQLSGRVLPQAKVEWRWPWARDDGFVTEVIEPRLAAIVGPPARNSAIIPNEDSLDLELDEENLYALNPFPGNDRVDGGDRLIYGSKFGAYGANGGSASLFFGELYSFQRNGSFDPVSGLSGNASDYVGLLQIKPLTLLNFTYRFDLDQENFRPHRNEVALNAGLPIFNVNLGYDSDNLSFPAQGISPTQQVSLGLNSKFAEYWSLNANAVFDLQEDQFRLIEFGVQYADECFTLKASIFHDYIHVSNIVPGTTFLLQFVFKNLGETKFGGSFGGSTVPSTQRNALE
jgi:LPS-assembly protein